MLEKTLGDLFREYRVRKGLQISDVEAATGTGAQYLLAIELDQLKLLPKEQLKYFVLSYAEVVDLPFDLLQEKSGLDFADNQPVPPASLDDFKSEELVVNQPVNQNFEPVVSEPISQPVNISETVTVPLFDTVQVIDSQEPIILTENLVGEPEIEESSPVIEPVQETIFEPLQEPVWDLKGEAVLEDQAVWSFEDNTIPTELPQEDNLDLFEAPNVFSVQEEPQVTPVTTEEDFQVPEESQTSRLSRRRIREFHPEEAKKGGFLSLLLLSLVALAVLCFVGYTFYQNFMEGSKSESNAEPVTTTQVEATTQAETTTQAVVEKVTLRTEGGGELLTAYVSGETAPLEVTFSLSEKGTESWVSLHDEVLGEQGSLLSADNKTYTASLSEGLTTGTLTIGITQDVDVTINGVALDKQALTTEGISYITLVVE